MRAAGGGHRVVHPNGYGPAEAPRCAHLERGSGPGLLWDRKTCFNNEAVQQVGVCSRRAWLVGVTCMRS